MLDHLDFVYVFSILFMYILICRIIALVASVICLWKPTLNKAFCISTTEKLGALIFLIGTRPLLNIFVKYKFLSHIYL